MRFSVLNKTMCAHLYTTQRETETKTNRWTDTLPYILSIFRIDWLIYFDATGNSYTYEICTLRCVYGSMKKHQRRPKESIEKRINSKTWLRPREREKEDIARVYFSKNRFFFFWKWNRKRKFLIEMHTWKQLFAIVLMFVTVFFLFLRTH